MANQISEPPAQIEYETYRTLWNAFLVSYLGESCAALARQPLRDLEHWAYDQALSRFLQRACRLPDVRCTTIRSSSTGSTAFAEALAPFRGRFPHAGRFAQPRAEPILNRRASCLGA